MKPGDLVLPLTSFEILYDNLESRDINSSYDWKESEVGLVVDVAEYRSEKYYDRVKVLVGDMLGWTWSDCVQKIQP